MKRSGFLTAACMLMAVSTISAADVATQPFVPETGFYWNPDQPGRGFAIEVQDRVLFLAAYVYTEDADPAVRQPLWFTASGVLDEGRSGGQVVYVFGDELQFSRGGQCLGCAYREPQTTPTGRPVDIVFDSPTRAEMTIDGEAIELFRFWYSSSITSPIFAMFGQWMIVTDFTAVDASILPFDGDLLEIGFTGSSQGQTTAEGFRGGTNVAVAGAYNALDDFYVIVVSERSNEYLAYYFNGFQFGTDHFSGLAERFTPGADLTGLGFPAQGHRISDRTFAEGVFGAKARGAGGESSEPVRPRHRPAGGKPRIDPARLNATVRLLEVRLAGAVD